MTYMEWGLSVDVRAVDINFIVMKQCNDIVNICMCDGMEQNITAYLLYLSNHFFE